VPDVSDSVRRLRLRKPGRAIRVGEQTALDIAPQRVSDERPFDESWIFRSTIESPRPKPCRLIMLFIVGLWFVAQPLDLSDDFKIVEGVPTFTWAGPVYWTSFHMFALSFDKIRMALVENETKIW